MKTPSYDFPPDAITHILAPPSMPSEMRLRAIVVPAQTAGVHYAAIINDGGRYWRFVKGPAAVRSTGVWRWLARTDPRWLDGPWAIQGNNNNLASCPDEIIDEFSKARTINPQP